MKHAVPGTGLFVYLLAMAAAGDAVAVERSSVTLHEGWTLRQVGREESYPAKVPGLVHLDLFQNGLIGDPFYRDNEKGLQWIGKTDWEYRTEFAVASGTLTRRNVEIVFDGLDTYAKVYLNGKEVLAGDNMYRRWRVSVAGKVKAKGNELRIVFRSPINEDLAKVTGSGYELPAVNDQGEKTSVYVRKAPYSFGWDWGPRFVTCGVWKPVRLEAWDDARIVDVAVRQKELGKDRAVLTAEVEVVAARPEKGKLPAAALEVTVEGGGAPVTAKVPLRAGATTHTVAFEIASPRLWWPNGYGEQSLYTVKTRLLLNGQAVDESRDRIGLRTLELRRAKDEWGTSFEFVVNGVPVFAKGANWIPADSFLTRLTRERYASFLRSARDAHMNMLRVWGGGIYESDDFYELADEMGLLVWQDFHFSCSLYPADQAFLASVAVEAEEAIRRLLQAGGIKIGAEAHRRSRPRTMGTLYWQLNDCWPVASWSSIDYFGRWKALQHYARRFYAPLLVSTSEESGQVAVHVVSDLTTPASGVLEARLLDLAGAVLWEEKQAVTVEPLSSRMLLSVERARLLEGRAPSSVFLEARLVVDGREAASNTRFFAPPKDMALVKAPIAVEVTPADGGLRVSLSSPTLARHVRLAYDGDDGTFSDNYFDLLPGRPVEVGYRPKGTVEAAAFRKGLEVVSILDAY